MACGKSEIILIGKEYFSSRRHTAHIRYASESEALSYMVYQPSQAIVCSRIYKAMARPFHILPKIATTGVGGSIEIWNISPPHTHPQNKRPPYHWPTPQQRGYVLSLSDQLLLKILRLGDKIRKSSVDARRMVVHIQDRS